MVRFNNHNVLAAAAAILALTTTPLTVLATPPPDMIEALSAYAAAGVTPTIAAGIKDVHRLVRRVEDGEEMPRADREEEIVILPPPGHRPYVSSHARRSESRREGKKRGNIGKELTSICLWPLLCLRLVCRSSSQTLSSAALGW